MVEKQFSVDLLLENLPGAVYRCKPDAPWLMEYLSTGITKITGYAPEEFTNYGIHYLSLIHPQDQREVHQTIRDAIQAGNPFQATYRLYDKEGGCKWIWEQGKAVYDSTHQIIALEGFIADITALKQTEHELAKSNERLALILESSSEGICGVGADHICTFMNRSGAAMLGCLPEELVGLHVHDIVQFHRPDGLLCRDSECPIVKATREGTQIRVENEVVQRRDGTSFSVSYSVAPKFVDSQLCGAVIVFSDITDRKRAEAALQAAQLNYRLATEAATVGTWEADYANGVVTISPITAKILGLPPDQKTILRSVWQSTIHPDDLPLLLQVEEEAWQTGESASLEYRQYHADGHLMWISMHGIVIKNERGFPAKVIGASIDITTQKNTENALKSEKERFQLLTEYSPDAILIDQHNVFVYANPAAARLFGATDIGDITGRPVADFLSQESLEIVCGNRQKIVQTEEQRSSLVELRMRRLDGALLDIQAVCGKITWEGEPAVQVMLRDVTLFKKTQQNLRHMSERLQLAIEGTGQGIWDWDVASNKFTFLGGMNRILGRAADETTNTNNEWRNAVHPDDMERVITTFQATLEGKTPVYECEYRLRAKDGSWKWVQARGLVAEHATDGSPLTVTGTLTDITASKESATLAWRHANVDPLTSLPNRRLFSECLKNELLRAQRSRTQLALLFIDLDGFKQVNDLYGHEVGDLLLMETAHRLSKCVRQTDIVARLGGDEFTIILTQLDDLEHIQLVCQKILDALSTPFRIKLQVTGVSASIGISLYPFDALVPEDMLRKADQAMYAAKQTGKNQFHYFTQELDEKAHFQLQIINELRHALERNELSVHYQPVIDLKDGTIGKAEALLRWNHPKLGAVGPAEFIPLAEEAGLIKKIGNWVFRQAALCSKHCNEITHAQFQIGVNKSPVQFMAQNDDSDWTSFLSELGLLGNSITVEITEGVLLHMSAKVESRLLEFRDAGIQVALDDFGTGYSSLSYLQKFSIDYLKIDQSFVKDIASNPHSRAIAESIILMAHKLGLKVIAEGVETEEQKACLLSAGCDYGQGYLFAPPLPEAELIGLLGHIARQHSNFLH
jgi:diguanylate cyclase (GGDEF)-like protein/PAS domain S-box-containing protein